MNHKKWHSDKKWSDQFIPEIKSILGQHLIAEPPMEEDAQRNTDLMVFRLDAVRIGCRVRKANYLSRYGGEFTIRAGRPSGVKTELTKIIEGWGDYFFYGFADEQTGQLAQWMLGDLKIFRIWFNRSLMKGKGSMPGIGKANTDGSSSFLAFRINELPPEFIVSCSWTRKSPLEATNQASGRCHKPIVTGEV